MAMSFLQFFVALCLLTNVSSKKSESKVERNLLNNLLANYSSYVRPTEDNTRPVRVLFDVKLGKLVKLDIKSQIMIANTRIMMQWNDPSLTWKKSDYNDTDSLNIPNKLVWTPDVLLHNTALLESKGKSDFYKSHVLVRNSGKVIWMSHVSLQASCSMNLKWFPFDQQMCLLTFGSISYTKNKLKLEFFKEKRSFTDIQAKFYYTSGHWKMTEMLSQKKDEYFECCMTPFSLIEYTFNWKRLSLYWILYLVLPCLCLSFLAVFTFFIPAATGERTGFAITTVLAMSVYLLVISDRMPEKSDESPLIGVLYIVLFFIMTAVLLSVIITTYLAYKVTKPPEYLRKFLKSKKKETIPPPSNTTPLKPMGTQNEVGPIAEDDDVVVFTGHQRVFRTVSERTRNISDRTRPSLRRHFSIISEQEEKEMENQEEWLIIAAKIDRILFWIFLVLTFVGPGIVLLCYL